MALSKIIRSAVLLACAAQAVSCATTVLKPMGEGEAAGVAFEPVPSGLPGVDIRRVSAKPKTFIPGETEPLTLRYATGTPVPTRVEILSEAGDVIRHFTSDAVGPEGGEVVWDGRDRSGKLVPSGIYLYRIFALDEHGRVRGIYGHEPIGGGEEVLPQELTFERGAGKVEFVVPEPARARVRMGIHALPVMRTYYDWEPLEAGRHTIEWDGLDTSGKVRLVDHPRFQAAVELRSLPQNSVHLRREPVNTQDPCAELCFQLALADSAETTDRGVPIVSEEVMLRIDVVDPAERARILNSRFEVMVFLDTVYVYEEEDGALPLNYRLDTRALNPGPHLVTVNVLSYDQRVGIQTLEFIKAAPLAAAQP